MKPKYKIGSWLKTDHGVLEVCGVHINKYASDNEENTSNVQYEFWGEDDWTDEDEIVCEMAPKK